VFGDNPPHWLTWANSSGARALTTMIAFIALVLSGVLAIRQQSYIACVADQQSMTDARTRAISSATDAERRAEADLLRGTADRAEAERRRQAVIAARNVTDIVRERNPAPPVRAC
jgi:hypothetical protein